MVGEMPVHPEYVTVIVLPLPAVVLASTVHTIGSVALPQLIPPLSGAVEVSVKVELAETSTACPPAVAIA